LIRSDFLKALGLFGLSGCIDINEDCMNKIQKYDWWNSVSSAFDLNQYTDVFNFQSDSASNFTFNGTKVSQWNDLTENENHAVQSTAASQPEYNNGEVTFSSDFLQFNEVDLGDLSLYLVLKTTDFSSTRTVIGGESINTRIIIGQSARQIRFNTSLNSGSDSQYYLGGEEYYQVLSFRRTGTTLTIKCNGRTLYNQAAPTNAGNMLLRFLGKTATGFYTGIIRAACASSNYLTDQVDTQITNYLFTKYNLPETSDCLVGFGDSITTGTGASVSANSYIIGINRPT